MAAKFNECLKRLHHKRSYLGRFANDPMSAQTRHRHALLPGEALTIAQPGPLLGLNEYLLSTATFVLARTGAPTENLPRVGC